MKQKQMLIIIILLFIFSLTWIGTSIYRSAVSTTISEEISKEIAPISPQFDTKTINKLKERKKIAPLFELGDVKSAPISIPNLEATGPAKLLL